MNSLRFEIFSPAVLQLVKSVQQIKNRKIARYGLKGTCAVCLCRLYESGEGLTASELSKEAEIDKAQVSRCMADMMQRGFVNRTDRQVRRYKQKYTLTEEGTAVAADVHQCMTEIRAALNKDITQHELAEFYRVLYKLCENFSELLAAQKDEEN